LQDANIMPGKKYSVAEPMKKIFPLIVALAVLSVGSTVLCQDSVPRSLYPYGAWNRAPGPSDPGPLDIPEFRPVPWIQTLQPSALRFGCHYGGGNLIVDHDLAAGQAVSFPPWPDFGPFFHRRHTELNDVYFSVQGGVQARGAEVLTISAETNVGLLREFKQKTDPGTGVAGFRFTQLLFFLADNEAAEIPLEGTNRIWNVEAIGALPLFTRFKFLFGYKYKNVTGSEDTYTTSVPIAFQGELPGLVGWRNLMQNFVNPIVYEINISEAFVWHGPLVGAGLRESFLGIRTGEVYLETLFSPILFGTYDFVWQSQVSDPDLTVDPEFNGITRTNMAGRYNYLVEVRTGLSVQLYRMLNLGLDAKYSHVFMRSTKDEDQYYSANAPPFLVVAYDQQAAQEIVLRQNFWAVGGKVSLTF